MVLGVVLLFVGAVLVNNGFCGLINADGKTTSALNILVGVLLFVINVILIIEGAYFAAGTGLLFAFTYLYVAANKLFNLNLKPYGIFCLAIAIVTIPCAVIAGTGSDADFRMTAIWLAWGVLWFTGFWECTLEKSLGKFSSAFAAAVGIFTGWIPGFLMIAGWW